MMRHDYVERRLSDHTLPTSLLPRPAPVEHPVRYGAGEEGDDGGRDRPQLEPAEAHEQHDSASYEGHHGPGAVAPQTYRDRRAKPAEPVGTDQPVQWRAGRHARGAVFAGGRGHAIADQRSGITAAAGHPGAAVLSLAPFCPKREGLARILAAC